MLRHDLQITAHQEELGRLRAYNKYEEIERVQQMAAQETERVRQQLTAELDTARVQAATDVQAVRDATKAEADAIRLLPLLHLQRMHESMYIHDTIQSMYAHDLKLSICSGAIIRCPQFYCICSFKSSRKQHASPVQVGHLAILTDQTGSQQ